MEGEGRKRGDENRIRRSPRKKNEVEVRYLTSRSHEMLVQTGVKKKKVKLLLLDSKDARSGHGHGGVGLLPDEKKIRPLTPFDTRGGIADIFTSPDTTGKEQPCSTCKKERKASRTPIEELSSTPFRDVSETGLVFSFG